jgi:galactose oxidase-like protein/Kelch motif protein
MTWIPLPGPRGTPGRTGRGVILALLALALPLDALATVVGTWTEIPGNFTPSARSLTGMVFDPVRNRLIMIGGWPGPQGDVWVQPLTGAPAWSKLNPTGTPPSARYGHTAIYQPGQDRVIVFGGFDTAPRNDVWALSLSGTPTWTKLNPTGTAPAARSGHVAIYDATRSRMVMFSGQVSTAPANDAWALSLGAGTPAWSLVSQFSPRPTARVSAAAAYDQAGDRLIMFGGWFPPGGADLFSDTWVLPLSGGNWTQLSPSGTVPIKRRDHSMIFAGGKVFMFGGWNYPGGTLDDVQVLTMSPTPAWSQITPTGPGPSGRNGHRAIYDASNDRMVIFGGESGGYFDDTWALPLSGAPIWSLLDDPRRNVNVPRSNFAMANAGGAMVAFGGANPGYRNDTVRLDLTATPAWQPVAPPTAPSPRSGHRAIFDAPRNRVLIFGGFDGNYLNDVYQYSPASDTWQPVVTSGTPPGPRISAGLVYDPIRERMLVIGGYILGTIYDDVWALSLTGTPQWTKLSPTGAPLGPRRGHAVIYQPSQDRVVVFGGFDGSNFRNDVWALSLGTASWTRLFPSGSPFGSAQPREESAAVYDAARNHMIVAGGRSPIDTFDDVWALWLGPNPIWTRVVPPGSAPGPGSRAYMGAVYDPIYDRMIVKGGADDTGVHYGDTWALTIDGLTPTVVSLVSARGTRDAASVTWHVSAGEGARFTAWRRTDPGGWTTMGDLVPDDQQKVTLEDHSVVEGARYQYRLGIVEGTKESFAGEVWVDIPRAATLSLVGARPNPAAGPFAIGFSLEDDSPARLELFDTAGRGVLARNVGSLGAGEHEVRIEHRLPNGVYTARLRQNGRAITTRVMIGR